MFDSGIANYEHRAGNRNQLKNSMLCALCSIVAIFLSSCLTMSPPKEQTGNKIKIEHTASDPQSKSVIWKSAGANKQPPAAITRKMSENSVEANDKSQDPTIGMVLIPAGEFLMGSKTGEGDRDEYPQHKVYLDAYYIDMYEVTNAQYYQFWLADGGKKSKHTPASYGSSYMIGDWPEVAKIKPKYPVVGITWYDAIAYAKWSGKRLPTESEWEKAARGAKAKIWPWSSRPDSEMPVADGTSQNPISSVRSNRRDGNDGYDNTTAPVGSYSTGASSYGIHDMAGNVWEWVMDWYNEDYYASNSGNNPRGPDMGKLKVVKGGSWNNREHNQRCANRYYCYPDSWGNTLGFRCAKDVTSGE